MDEDLIIESIIQKPHLIVKAMRRLEQMCDRDQPPPKVLTPDRLSSVAQWLKDGGADSFRKVPRQPKSEVRAAYEQWCKEHHLPALRKNDFNVAFMSLRPDIESKQARFGTTRHMAYELTHWCPPEDTNGPDEDLL